MDSVLTFETEKQKAFKQWQDPTVNEYNQGSKEK